MYNGVSDSSTVRANGWLLRRWRRAVASRLFSFCAEQVVDSVVGDSFLDHQVLGIILNRIRTLAQANKTQSETTSEQRLRIQKVAPKVRLNMGTGWRGLR